METLRQDTIPPVCGSFETLIFNWCFMALLLSEGLSSCPLSGSLGREKNLTVFWEKLKKACKYQKIPTGHKEINIKFNYKQDITTLGLFRNRSTDPSLLLEPYFGLFPWDGYAVDNWIEDKYLLPNANIREDIKFIHDFTIDELSKLLPPNSPKLMKLRSDLKENK